MSRITHVADNAFGVDGWCRLRNRGGYSKMTRIFRISRSSTAAKYAICITPFTQYLISMAARIACQLATMLFYYFLIDLPCPEERWWHLGTIYPCLSSTMKQYHHSRQAGVGMYCPWYDTKGCHIFRSDINWTQVYKYSFVCITQESRR